MSNYLHSSYGLARKLIHLIFPQDWREEFWQSDRPINLMLLKLRNKFEAIATSHDEIYDSQYYEGTIETESARSAPVISESIISEFHPQSVVDIGCGTGNILLELSKHNVDVLGFEYSQAAIYICQSKGLSVEKFDIESQKPLKQRADLTISTEVAEHLPASRADRYVDLLTSISDTVLITAATPGQGGQDHVNEQPNEYWIDKFKTRNFQYQKELTIKLRREWKEKQITHWYFDNVMVFENRNSKFKN